MAWQPLNARFCSVKTTVDCGLDTGQSAEEANAGVHHVTSESVPQAPVTARRHGGRTARVRRDVLNATLRHIAERGLEGLTIAAIATAAGVAQTTVYRRWPTPPSLVADALSDLAAERNPIPDTGDIRLDLYQLADQIAHLLAEPAIVRLLGVSLALSADPDVATARTLFWENRFRLSQPVVDRAIRRGQLRPHSNPHEVIETLVAPLYYRLLVSDQAIDRDLIHRCVDTTLKMHAQRVKDRHHEETTTDGYRGPNGRSPD